jgi:hypothetical protein
VNKILSFLLLAVSLPLLAQAPPFGQDPAAQSAAVVAGFKPVLEGDTRVELSAGTFELGGGHASASSYVPLVGIFTGSVIAECKAAGEFSDTKAPANLKRIVLGGYSPKAMGLYGAVVLCVPKVDDGARVLKTKDFQIEKSYWKGLADSAKVTQTSDGVWVVEILKPLAPGHYILTFLKNQVAYWDFDVK